MADVFVSYAHVDHGPVRDIVTELERQGLTVWWDIAMRSGDAYANVIERELAGAKCVLAVWSRSSRDSHWVQAESSLANDTRKLVQVVLHRDVRPPLPFNIVHYELLERRPNENDQSWIDLLASIRSRIGGTAAPTAPPRAPSPVDAQTVLSAVSIVGFAAYLWLTQQQAAPLAGVEPIYLAYAAVAAGAVAALMTFRRAAGVLAAGG